MSLSVGRCRDCVLVIVAPRWLDGTVFNRGDKREIGAAKSQA